MDRHHYRVALRPSRGAAVFIVASGAATLALVISLPLGALLKALLAFWIGAAMLEAFRSVAMRGGANGVREVSLLPGGEIEVVDALRRLRRGRLADGAFVAPWLTILRWRPERSLIDRTIVVLPDMLDAETFRELRVRLKL